MDKQARIKQLEKDIKFYQDDYYKGGQLISDAEFDAMWDELTLLDPSNPILKNIGSDIDDDSDDNDNLDGFAKAAHIIPMGSQQKAKSPEEFMEKWGKKHNYSEYLIQFKLDGASIELQYEKGIFVKAVTRGDGTIGDDITENVMKMQNIVHDLKNNFTGGIRGEVLMSHSTHKSLFSDKANCRNAAAGLMKRKDGEGVENLMVIVYDASSTTENIFSTELEKIEWLSKNGFQVVPTIVVNSHQEIIDYRTSVMDSIRNTLEYDIDGLVIKNNDIDIDDLSKHRPDKQIAFKFSLDEAITTLKEVVWNENGSTYTPIAIVDPVQLNGTTVKRASLCNPMMIEKMHLFIGSKIIITKRGEIIPKIESLVDNPKDVKVIDIPGTCDSCGSKLVNEGTRLYCPNSNCKKKKVHQITKWINTLKIMELGTTLIQKFFDEGIITSIYDLYTLKASDISSLERMGERSAEKIVNAIKSNTSVTLPQFIGGFDIEDVGKTLTTRLVDSGIDTLDKLMMSKKEDFTKVSGFSDITAEKLINGLNENKEEMIKLSNEFITIKSDDAPKSGKLQGKSFCFTGTLDTMKRSEAEKLVINNGGTIGSVNKNLSYLVTNEASTSSKYKKAIEFGTPVIDEQQFLNMMKN